MIQATFYAERKPCAPVHFEELLTRRFEGWTHHNTSGCWHSSLELSQTYTVIFSEYPEFRFDLSILADKLKTELAQDEILVTIQKIEVL